ncbi:MAG: VWA domain-containing protein, partial [Caulobacterales bacterium]
MFQHFFAELRAAKAPVSLREYLTLIEAMEQGVIPPKIEDFYYLARAALIKDERHLDAFDRVFSKVFKGIVDITPGDLTAEIPEEWLRKLSEKFLTEAEKAEIQALGGWEKLMETLAERLKEQQGRHEGGNKWIGTGGTSPFGAYGY